MSRHLRFFNVFDRDSKHGNDKGQTVGHSGQAAASKNTLGPSAYIPLLLAPVLLAEWNSLEACFIVIHSHSPLHLCVQCTCLSGKYYVSGLHFLLCAAFYHLKAKCGLSHNCKQPGFSQPRRMSLVQLKWNHFAAE